MDFPILESGTVDRSDEYVALTRIREREAKAIALIAPENPFHRDNGRVAIEWLISESSAEDQEIRRTVTSELEAVLLKNDDPCPWTNLIFGIWKLSQPSAHSGIQWTIKNPRPIAPSRENWDFGRIPDHELIACCIWEYGRESHTLGMVAAYHWVRCRHIWYKKDYAADSDLREWHDKEQARIEIWLNEVGFDYDAFCELYWRTDFPLIEIYDALSTSGGPSATAWQQLSESQRESLVRKVGESSVLLPLVPAALRELEQLWEANNSRLLEVRSENRSLDDDSEDCELFSLTSPTAVTSEEEQSAERIAVALTVDFSRFTDREIVEVFRKWVKENRPADWRHPRRVFPNAPQRGRKLVDYQVALERLGLMRLLNDNYPDEMRSNYPDVWKKMCRDGTHFRRHCQLACDFFRSLFPFLPEEELPRSAKPIEVWEPEIEAELASSEAEKISSGGNKSE